MRLADRVRVVLTQPASGVNAVDLEDPLDFATAESQPDNLVAVTGSSRSKDRHKPGYMAAYMRKHRAK